MEDKQNNDKEEKKDDEEKKTPASQPQSSVSQPPPSQSGGTEPEETSMGLDPNLAALLAYVLGWVSGLIMYLLETKNSYVRFHALQSILLSIAATVVWIGVSIIFSIFTAVPGIGPLFAVLGGLTSAVLGLGFFILWIMLMIKAYQGEKWMLPIIGEVADKNS